MVDTEEVPCSCRLVDWAFRHPDDSTSEAGLSSQDIFFSAAGGWGGGGGEGGVGLSHNFN